MEHPSSWTTWVEHSRRKRVFVERVPVHPFFIFFNMMFLSCFILSPHRGSGAVFMSARKNFVSGRAFAGAHGSAVHRRRKWEICGADTHIPPGAPPIRFEAQKRFKPDGHEQSLIFRKEAASAECATLETARSRSDLHD